MYYLTNSFRLTLLFDSFPNWWISLVWNFSLSQFFDFHEGIFHQKKTVLILQNFLGVFAPEPPFFVWRCSRGKLLHFCLPLGFGWTAGSAGSVSKTEPLDVLERRNFISVFWTKDILSLLQWKTKYCLRCYFFFTFFIFRPRHYQNPVCPVFMTTCTM